MKIQLRKYEDGYTLCAYDSKGVCHINKPIDQEEFDGRLAFYVDNGYDVNVRNDEGQSEELYEIELYDRS